MLCTLSARRLEPGSFDEFRSAFESMSSEGPDEVMKRWKRVYVCRDVTDENVILTFGLFDGSVDDLRKVQSDLGGEGTRVAQFGPLVDSVLLDGSYEVLDEITP